MPNGFGILFALFGGVPLWFWAHAETPAAYQATGLNIILSLLLHVGFLFGAGWLTGYAVKKIKHG